MAMAGHNFNVLENIEQYHKMSCYTENIANGSA